MGQIQQMDQLDKWSSSIEKDCSIQLYNLKFEMGQVVLFKGRSNGWNWDAINGS